MAMTWHVAMIDESCADGVMNALHFSAVFG